MRYDAEHKERTRRTLLREAAATIRESGPDRLGVAQLMAKAGLTHGGFYAHFKSKDDLLAHAVVQAFDERYEGFTSCMRERTPAEGLALFVDHYLSTSHRDHIARGCPLPSLAGNLGSLPAAARRRFNAGAERLTNALADVLESLGHRHSDTLAASVLAEMVGAITLARAASAGQSEKILKSSRDAIKHRLGLS